MANDPMIASDFDFFIGHWRVEHRLLERRLAGCESWASFGGTTVVISTLGGAGNIDDNLLEHPDGRYRAVTLRAYDARQKQWSIWWLDGRRPRELDVPLVGRFDGDLGVFNAEDTLEGRPIKVRFTWHKRGARGVPHWEQAFSADGGRSWETNWTMDFHPETESST